MFKYLYNNQQILSKEAIRMEGYTSIEKVQRPEDLLLLSR